MKIKQYVAFALIGLALGGCNKPEGNDPDVVEPEGRPAKLKLSLALPNIIQTYAGETDPNATTEETAIDHVDVFVYDDGDGFGLTYERYTAAQIAAGTVPFPNLREITPTLDVRTGRKQIYVGVNLPDEIVDRLKTGHYVNEVFSTINFVDGSGNVAFFNADIDDDGTGNNSKHIYNIVEGGTNEITIDVARLVSKIIVKQTADLLTVDASGGTLSDLQFTIGQRNQVAYVLPLIHKSGDDPADPNYANGSAASASQLALVDDASYVPVNASTVTNWADAGTQKVYAPENTIDDAGGAAQHNDVTYVSVRAKFEPNVFEDPADEPAIWDGTFYAVFTGNDDEDGIGQRYFYDQDNADAYVLANPTTAAATVHTYTEGYCYYRIYLNQGQNYSFYRNNIYVATITHINTIGTTGKDVLPGSANTPTYPGAPIPEVNPVIVPSDRIVPIVREPLTTSLSMVTWNLPTPADYELY